jgi:Fe-S-cluster containining protein
MDDARKKFRVVQPIGRETKHFPGKILSAHMQGKGGIGARHALEYRLEVVAVGDVFNRFGDKLKNAGAQQIGYGVVCFHYGDNTTTGLSSKVFFSLHCRYDDKNNYRDHMSFSFACTKCGKCCKGGGPALSIDEVFKYQDVFISGLHWSAYHASDDETTTLADGSRVSSVELHNHFDSLSGTFLKRRGDKTYPLVYPAVTGYDLAPGNACTALNEDNTCRLHADKPERCRSVPFDPVMPEAMQWFVLRKFKFDCMKEIKETAGENLIFSGGKITDAGYKDDYGKRLSAMERDMPTLAAVAQLIEEKPSALAPSFDQFLAATDRGRFLETSMLPLLVILIQGSEEDKRRVLGYLVAQERLISAAIDNALRERNKSHRERTAMMRDYLKIYTRMLESDVMKGLAA